MEKTAINHLMNYQETKLEKYKPNKAVHYCSLATFNAIVQPHVEKSTMPRIDDETFMPYEAKYVNFFATDINYLNDREEYYIGKKNIEAVAGKIKDSVGIEETFIACFCKETDNLTQWKYYGKETGLAVEFDTDDVVINYCPNCKCNEVGCKGVYPKGHDIRFMPFEVYYCPRLDDASRTRKEKTEKRIYEMLPHGDDLNKINERTAILGTIPYIKHDAFKDECESRIILYHCDHNDERCSLTKYRVANVIKPYLELRMFYGNSKASKKIPIKSVTIGPCAEPNLFIRSIYHTLETDIVKRERDIEHELITKGFVETTEGIKIRKSKAPFRSYQ